MTKPGTRVQRIVCCGVAFALASSLFPLAGCAPQGAPEESAPETQEDAQPTGVSDDPGAEASADTIDYNTETYLTPDEKKESFDDGSPVLSVRESQAYANADTQTLTVTAENATFASDVAPVDVHLTGGMAEWTVQSVSRDSDTQVTVVAQRPAEVAPYSSGASIAGASFAATCLDIHWPDTSEAEAEKEELAASAQQDGSAEEEAAVESEYEAQLPEGAVIEEQEFGAEEVPEGQTDPADANGDGVADADPDASYEVSVPFVTPALAVDVADTEIRDGSVAYRLVASDFVLPETLSASDFSIKLADAAPAGTAAPQLTSVERLGDFEMEAVVAGDPLSDGSPLPYCAIVYAKEANDTGGDVLGNLLVPGAWLDVRTTEETDSVQATVQLRNSDDDLSEGDVSVGVVSSDGTVAPADDADVTFNDDGTATVTVDNAQGDVAGVSVDVGPVAHASGVQDDPDPAVSLLSSDSDAAAAGAGDSATSDGAQPSAASGAPTSPVAFSALSPFAPQTAWAAEGDGASILSSVKEWAKNIDYSSIALTGAKNALGALASAGWSMARTTILQNTIMGDRSNQQIYQELTAIEAKVDDIADQLKDLSAQTQTNYDATIVNDVQSTLVTIQGEYNLVADYYDKVLSATDEQTQRAAIDTLVAEGKSHIENLYLDLRNLHAKLVSADSAKGRGAIDVYDGLVAATCNWAPDAVPRRNAYRAEIGALWAKCAELICVAYGSDPDSHKTALDDLDKMTSQVKDLIDSSEIAPETYQYSCTVTVPCGDGNVTLTKNAGYCYTTNQWYAVYTGDESSVKWSNAFCTTTRVGKYIRYYEAMSPFTTYDTRTKRASFESLFMSTSEADKLMDRAGSRSLQEEIRSFNGPVPKYLVTSTRFDKDQSRINGTVTYDSSDWYFDTFEDQGSGKASAFTKDKMHFNGEIQQKLFSKKRNNVTKSSTAPGDMFVLVKVPAASSAGK